MPSSLPNKIENGQVHAVFMTIGHPIIAEVLAGSKANTLFVDLEHRPTSVQSAEQLIRSVEAKDNNVSVVIRIPEPTDAWIKHALDTGADGILIPMVETRAEAENVVNAGKYPPEGRRGVAGVRATDYGSRLDEYVTTANENTAIIVQIETQTGYKNASEIARVDGVTSVFIGPTDLSSSLTGVYREDTDEFEDVVADIRTSAHNANCPVGIYANDPNIAQRRLNEGFDYLIAGTDISALRVGTEQFLDPFTRTTQN